MADVPEDRGPSSLRIVKYDPSNPIHEGLVSRQHPNFGTPVNAHIDARKDHIVMPVAPGMEKEPAPLTSSQIKSKKTAVKKAEAVKKGAIIKTDAPSMVTPKDAGKIYEGVGGGKGKKLSREEMVAKSNATAAKIKAKREGKA